MKLQLFLILAPLLVVANSSSSLNKRQWNEPQSVEGCEETFKQCQTHSQHHHPGGMTLEQCKDERKSCIAAAPKPTDAAVSARPSETPKPGKANETSKPGKATETSKSKKSN